MLPVRYAEERNINQSTVYDAIKRGAIVLLPDGMLDVEATDAGFLADFNARKQWTRDSEATRIRRLNAGLVEATAQISADRRRRNDLQRSTAKRGVADPAQRRRVARALAALDALPDLFAVEAAEMLGRPVEATRAALRRFVDSVLEDIGTIQQPAEDRDGPQAAA